MHIFTIFRILGVLLMIFSACLLPPIAVAKIYHEADTASFATAFTITFITGFLAWFPCRDFKGELKIKDGFLVVVLLWAVLCLFGAIPFMLAMDPELSITNAVFEAVSGLTTTGATILTHLDTLPHDLMFYRLELHLLGGMGIIVLAVAILPMLGIGGMQLYRAETPGPIKDNKLTPRITETAKTLWFIYMGLVAACALAYWACGMPLFNAICESFSTVSTGGFSTHDESIGFYHNPFIEWVAVIFMLLGSINFGLHFLTLSNRRISHYWQDLECRTYLSLLLIGSSLVVFMLLQNDVFYYWGTAVIKGVFDVVSLATTTGLLATPYDTWPTFVPILLVFFGIIGGCAGSTSGGIKMIRILLLYNQGSIEVKRLLHPRGVYPIRFGSHGLPEHVIQAMWGFISVFFAIFLLLILLFMATGLDLTTAYGCAAACLSNFGASIGAVANGFGDLPTSAKWICSVAMLAGRLEIFTLLVLFSPEFWR